jgi:hypothetical protein
MAQPWRLDHSTVLDSDGNPVAIIADPAGDANGERIEWPWVYDEALPESHVQAEANAALIIAAPDMLAALSVALTADECPCCGRDNTGHGRCASDDCPGVQAIAKATGLT